MAANDDAKELKSIVDALTSKVKDLNDSLKSTSSLVGESINPFKEILTISEQLKLIKRLFDKFKNDLSIPIALLEKGPLNPDMDLDDDTCLLLELSVRVDILNNSYKIDRILGQDKTTDNNNIIDMDLEF